MNSTRSALEENTLIAASATTILEVDELSAGAGDCKDNVVDNDVYQLISNNGKDCC